MLCLFLSDNTPFALNFTEKSNNQLYDDQYLAT